MMLPCLHAGENCRRLISGSSALSNRSNQSRRCRANHVTASWAVDPAEVDRAMPSKLDWMVSSVLASTT